MSKDLNQCNFIGRLGKDPELKYLANGNAVVNFSIGCSDDYKNKNTGENVSQTNWVNVVAFRRLAEIIGEYCKKGSKVFVSGKFTVRKWQDKEGNDRYTTEIVANEMQMLDSRSTPAQSQHQQDKANGYQPQGAPQSGMGDFPDDDIPFARPHDEYFG